MSSIVFFHQVILLSNSRHSYCLRKISRYFKTGIYVVLFSKNVTKHQSRVFHKSKIYQLCIAIKYLSTRLDRKKTAKRSYRASFPLYL